jgi:zinc transport system substrate-binding protein
LQSWTQEILADTGEAAVLLSKNQSPHGFQLKPSQMQRLHDADMIIYVDENLESFLKPLLSNFSAKTKLLELSKAEGLRRYKRRNGGLWEEHKHEENNEHEHEDHSDAVPEILDLHIWLDPKNAVRMVAEISANLRAVKPENAQIYSVREKKIIARINALDRQLMSAVKPLQGKGFFVFHDAYQYFEQRYGLNALGSITLDPNESLSLSRMQKLRDKIQQGQVICVFREPQFSEKSVNSLVADKKTRIGLLDPLGADLPLNQDFYENLLHNLLENLQKCLVD